jgi:predicted HNH restriction endonuclease
MSFKNRPECCDFHHIDPKTKINDLRTIIRYSIKAAKKEIRKCIPLCANCHRTRHKNTSMV